MSAKKRAASSLGAIKLTTHTSAFNPQVTLLEIAEEPSPRRSKRVKTEPKTELDADESLLDLEDLEYSPTSTPSPKKKKQARTPSKAKEDSASPSGSATPSKRAVKSPKKPKPVPQLPKIPHPAPHNWRETYDAITQMRASFVAPVDTMGCQRAQLEETIPENRRFATLVALMLSSQTRDEVMHAATVKLREALGGSISVAGVIAADDSVILNAICKVGFFNKKAQYIKTAAIRLRDEFNSDVPKTVDELCSLKGVGPKMAFLTLEIAWNITSGIGVDVHVHRITNLLGWHKPPTKTPEDTRLNLQSWLPKELWRDINHMMVGFGQVVCLPSGPRCDACQLPSKGLCPSARAVTSKNRKAIAFISTRDSQESPAKVEIVLEEEEEKMVVPLS
ncbi:DNA glycosylase [Pholiota molesta]|nr:DNA glycosylase [Pholiota molesta]